MKRIPSSKSLRVLTVAATIGLTGTVTFASEAPSGMVSVNELTVPAELPEKDLEIKSAPDSQWTGVWTRTSLLGDMGGLRSQLGRSGISLGLTETSELLGTLKGGLQSGQEYHGVTTLTLGLDTQQAGAWYGGTFNVSALQTHGRPFSADYVGSLQTASGTETYPGLRLWEAWFQQKMLDDKVDIRIGQQSIDQEFMVSQYAGTFMGTMFGWPAVPSYDMPAGGPAFPLSGLGIRLRANLGHSITLLAGAYAGNPANSTSDQDPQKVNDTGTTFSLSGGTLYIAELQFGRNQPEMGEIDTGHKSGLPGTYKIGAWYHDASFADTGLDSSGLSLADPASSGNPMQHAGNYSFYAVADQVVWRESADGARAVNVFARVMTAPGDRNLISLSANLGVTMNAPFEGRDNDVVGLGIAYVQVGNHTVTLDRDTNAFNGTSQPVRDSETFLEATYQYQVTPWWQVQGSLQYTLHPGAGVANPNDASQTSPIPNAWVLGLRTNITF